MLRVILASALAFGLTHAASAVRVFDEVENSFELSLIELDLPESATGTLSFRACGDCPLNVHRVTPATRYLINGRELALADFLIAADGIRAIRTNAASTTVGVYFEIASGRVTRISLHRRGL